jgi:L-2-hydroxyglutarate oxidase LhgO
MNISGDDAIYAEKSIKVICIGAGVSGILLAYKLKQHCAKFSLVAGNPLVATMCNSEQT